MFFLSNFRPFTSSKILLDHRSWNYIHSVYRINFPLIQRHWSSDFSFFLFFWISVWSFFFVLVFRHFFFACHFWVRFYYRIYILCSSSDNFCVLSRCPLSRASRFIKMKMKTPKWMSKQNKITDSKSQPTVKTGWWTNMKMTRRESFIFFFSLLFSSLRHPFLILSFYILVSLKKKSSARLFRNVFVSYFFHVAPWYSSISQCKLSE